MMTFLGLNGIVSSFSFFLELSFSFAEQRDRFFFSDGNGTRLTSECFFSFVSFRWVPGMVFPFGQKCDRAPELGALQMRRERALFRRGGRIGRAFHRRRLLNFLFASFFFLFCCVRRIVFVCLLGGPVKRSLE